MAIRLDLQYGYVYGTGLPAGAGLVVTNPPA
jgi:hypothetical protein